MLKLARLAPIIGVPVALVTCAVAIYGLAAEDDNTVAKHAYQRAVWLHGLAAVIE